MNERAPTSDPTAAKAQSETGARRRPQPRQILVAAAVIYVVLFIVLNRRRIDISFVFFTVRTLLLIALALVALLSFAAGYFLKGRRVRRERRG